MGRKNWKRAPQAPNRGAYDQRNQPYLSHNASSPPDFPRSAYPSREQQQKNQFYEQDRFGPSSSGPRSVDSGWRGQPQPKPQPQQAPSNPNPNPTPTPNLNHDPPFQPNHDPSSIRSGSSSQQQYGQNQRQNQHQASSYYPSAGSSNRIPPPSKSFQPDSSTTPSSIPRTDHTHFNSLPSRASPSHSNGNSANQTLERRPLDPAHDDRPTTRRESLGITATRDSPPRYVRSEPFQSSRIFKGDSPKRDVHEGSRGPAGGSEKGKERDRGDYSDWRSGDQRRDRDFHERSRPRDFRSNDSKRKWKNHNSIGGYGRGRTRHDAYSPPRNGTTSNSDWKDDDRPGGRSRRKRSRSISDISSSPRSPGDRRRRKRSSSRSRERERERGSENGGSENYRNRDMDRHRSREKDRGNGGGGGSGSGNVTWKDRRVEGKTRSISPTPDISSATSRVRNRYQVRDDIEKARAQVRERDAAAQRERKEQERLERLREQEELEELEKLKADDEDVKESTPSLTPSVEIAKSDDQGKVLQRKERNPSWNSTDGSTLGSHQDSSSTVLPTQPRTGGWTVIRAGSSGVESNDKSRSAGEVSQDQATSINGHRQGSEKQVNDLSKDEAPSSAMLAAMAAAGMTELNQDPNANLTQESQSSQGGPDSMVLPSPPRSPARALPTEGYEKLSLVGEGTYGQVFKARAESSGVLVALKKIRMESEKDGFPVTALREIKLLQSLKHENVVRLHEMMVSKGSFYMVFEYLEHDLSGVLNHPSLRFEPQHLKSLSFQLLSALSYLHKKSVLHRDLKCSNILLDNFGRLKIADFGLARLYAKRRKEDYTNRVVTLWYRPPELLFGATIYGPEIDMWGAGCIFVELFTRRAIFAGNDELHQIQVITDRLGPVTSDRWPEAETLPWFELVKAPGSEGAAVEEKLAEERDQGKENHKRIQEQETEEAKHLPAEGNPNPGKTEETEEVASKTEESPELQISLEEKEARIFGKALGKYKLTPAALDVARALLSYDPRRRASAKEALEMEYFTTEHPIAERPAGILSSAGGEWHEYESRLHKKSRQPTAASSSNSTSASTSRKH